MYFKISNALTGKHRHIDENGYLHVDKSPILKSGILEYLGSELLPEGEDTVDGVEVDPDKIYKVFIPEDELRKGANSFKLLPITNDHTWLGNEGEDAKDYQEGTIGENVYVEDGMLYAPLVFTGNEIIKDITEEGKEELSSSYYNRFEKANNKEYDFIARDIKGNHLALVDRGRCGSEVRVLNEKIGVIKMAKKAKIANEAILKLDGKEINLDRFFEEEAREDDGDGVELHTDSIVENEDKREIIRELMDIAAKPAEDFEGGDDEKVRTIAELAEKIAYRPSETSETDNDEDELIEKKEEKEEEEKIENEDEEEVKEENGCHTKNEDDDEEEKADSKSMNAMVSKISNAIKKEQAKLEQQRVRAYNKARAVVGDFNPFGMTSRQMYAKALNHLGVELDGKETIAELSAMLKACSSVQSKVDNSFTYGQSSSEEREFNV